MRILSRPSNCLFYHGHFQILFNLKFLYDFWFVRISFKFHRLSSSFFCANVQERHSDVMLQAWHTHRQSEKMYLESFGLYFQTSIRGDPQKNVFPICLTFTQHEKIALTNIYLRYKKNSSTDFKKFHILLFCKLIINYYWIRNLCWG